MKKLTRKKVIEVLDRLELEYPDARCALDYDSLFHLVVAVVLSAQTTDVSVNKITPELFSKYPEPKDLAAAEPADVEKIIRTIGLYKNKTKNIIALSKALDENYDGVVPGDFEELQKLPGVGRKTANVVISEGFGGQRIAVDTHVFRVSNRIGLVNESDVLNTEKSLMKVLPCDRWTRTHHLLIFHGRRCCTAKKPQCEICCLKDICVSIDKL